MTAAEFKETWKQIEGKPVNIKYGKSTFRNKILYNYVEAKGIVHIKDGADISTRSIKSIELIAQKEVPVVAVEAEEVVVTPSLPADWDKYGYFLFRGKYGGNWKAVQIIGVDGTVIVESDTTFEHKVLFNKVRGFKTQIPVSPSILVDDTGAAPVYYNIKKGIGNDWFFQQIK